MIDFEDVDDEFTLCACPFCFCEIETADGEVCPDCLAGKHSQTGMEGEASS